MVRLIIALMMFLPLFAQASSTSTTLTASGQSLELNVQVDSELSAVIDISGTFTGGEFAFEATADSINWRPMLAKRSNAEIRESATGVINGNPGYYWSAAFGPVRKVRVRCSALSSGSVFVIINATIHDISMLQKGSDGQAGVQGPQGIQGIPGVNAIGSGTAISPSFGTAFQATDTAKPAFISVNVTSTAVLSLSGGQTHSAQLVIAPTSVSACTAGTGSRIIGRYSNSNTGTLSVGLNLSTISLSQLQAGLPTGFWACLMNTAGTVSVVSAFDQSIG